MAKANRPDTAPTDLPADAAPSDGAAPGGMAALDIGRAAIRQALATMPNAAGVYRMIAEDGEVLYVGKAKRLKSRVQAYANPAGLHIRILKMVSLTRRMEVVRTHTEAEALLLESNLIKRLRPRFNILLRDDKSFPFILLRRDHDWAQLVKHRGARRRKGEYFGPFASAGAVNETLNALQKAFPLRSCSDSIFDARTRPCLQYQIKRCTGPCVGRIAAEPYEALVDEARAFLSGRSHAVQAQMKQRMADAAEALDYETAALYRDRLRALAHVQSHQGVNVASVDEADVLAVHQEGGETCIQVFFFRAGQNWGNRPFFPSHGREQGPAEVLTAFIGQFYDDKPPPRLILVNEPLDDRALLEEALGVRADRKVAIACPQRGDKRELVARAALNAREALSRRLAESATQRRLMAEVADLFGLDGPPNRIEVYDNSHIMGTDSIGAMIVAGPEGYRKNAYRKFNIKNDKLSPGDDYGMMREVLTRRFSRLLRKREAEGEDQENDRIAGEWPDLVLIDGGAGQLTATQEVFAELGVSDVCLAAIAKGEERNAGRERIFMPDRAPFFLRPRSAVSYFVQRLRDEAHRYAIGTHRARRAKSTIRSALDEIEGVGPKRKRALLNHFGSVRAIEQAALADLEHVEGISRAVAEKVFDHFHPEAR